MPKPLPSELEARLSTRALDVITEGVAVAAMTIMVVMAWLVVRPLLALSALYKRLGRKPEPPQRY